MTQDWIRIHPDDTVAVVTCETAAGRDLGGGLTACDDIPLAHKVALTDLAPGDAVIRYGARLGTARVPIPRGGHVHEQNILEALPPDLDRLEAEPFAAPFVSLPRPDAASFSGYRNPHGYAGTRNLLGIIPTVQCVAGVLNQAVDRIRADLLPRYPHVDGVVVLNHDYGCGVAIDAPEAVIPIRTLQSLLHHPNFAADPLVVGLGCEKLTPQRLMGPERASDVLLLQDCAGYDAMLAAILARAEQKLVRLEKRRRETLPLSQLIIGVQCGGSDAFSGMTANPAVGIASDLLVASGATVLFSEVSEVRDAVHLLASRAASPEVRARLIGEMRWYDRYLAAGGVDRSANPTPGNKQGGLSNIVEKAMGSVAKSGLAPIAEVLAPGQRPTRSGLIFAATPASDLVCGSEQLASGITLQVFTTGRGTPYSLAAAPVIKVSSQSNLQSFWQDLIDFDAGRIISQRQALSQAGQALFRQILAVAGGEKTCAEARGLTNDFCIFNPAPVT